MATGFQGSFGVNCHCLYSMLIFIFIFLVLNVVIKFKANLKSEHYFVLIYSRLLVDVYQPGGRYSR